MTRIILISIFLTCSAR